MPALTFTHPSNPLPLVIETGANDITWGYGLNYQTYPTYGGEVVQILSAYTDDLMIQGEVRTYAKMETIYEWFLTVMQATTQGGGAKAGTGFDSAAVTFRYPARGWEQHIILTELPGLRYARDIAMPQYQIKAHVVDSQGDLNDAIVSAVREASLKGVGLDLTEFGRIHAGIGYTKEDPFSNPFPQAKSADIDAKVRKSYQQLGDYFSTIVESYNDGDFTSLLKVDYGSVPAGLWGGTGAQNSPKNQVGEGR